MNEIPLGRYQHYKGNLYEVIGVAHHSESLQEVVVYKALYKTEFGEGSLWVRPKDMFCSNVIVDGKQQPRFKYLAV